MALSAATFRERGVACGISALRDGCRDAEPEVEGLPVDPLGDGERRQSFLGRKLEMKRQMYFIFVNSTFNYVIQSWPV